MKITSNELDKDLLLSIRRLDELELNYDDKDGNVVMYDGNSYYTGSIKNDDIAKVYFTDNEIQKFKNHFYKSGDNYISSFDTKLAVNDIYSVSTKNLINKVAFNFLCKADSNIKNIKEFGAYYYLITSSGKIYKINKDNPSTQNVYDIFAMIRTNFAIRNFNPSMITDFLIYEHGFLVSVLGSGIYYLNINTGEYELKFNYPTVTKMVPLKNGNLLFLTKEKDYSVLICNFASGQKIESYGYLSLSNQFPSYAKVLSNGDLIVLGELGGYSNSKNILHYWVADDLEYTNIDYMIGDHKHSIYYEPKFVIEDNGYLYIAGTFKNKIFIWRWTINNISESPIEYVFDYLSPEYDDFKCIDIHGNEITLIIKDKMIKITFDRQLLENNKLDKFNTTNLVICADNKYIAIDGKDAVYYTTPKYAFYPKIQYNVYEDDAACNNINIYIKTENLKEPVMFFNANDKTEIIPEFYGITQDDEHIISIRNSDCMKIGMTIDYNKDAVVSGIVINYNREYLK